MPDSSNVTPPPPTNVLTLDVEDWYHLSGEQLRGRGVPRTEIVARQLDRVLELLGRHDTRATFFCLGGSLESRPDLVRRIAEAGHEVASHGWGHQPIRTIGLDAFRKDLRRSLDWLQDILGRPVRGYRAPAFSVPPEQLEQFYDICFEEGLSYDSSVFPIRGRRYGIPDGPRQPSVVREDGTRRLVELPLSTMSWLGRRWPVAGGGYWRLLPGRMIRAAVSRLNQDGLIMVTYLHPYEFDPHRLAATSAAGWSVRALRHGFKQNLRRKTMYRKLDMLLTHCRFGTVEDYLRGAGHL